MWGYDNEFGMGYKPLKATKRNVEDFIAMQLGYDPYSVLFVKLDEKPTVWKHSCMTTGVTILNVYNAVFDDGTPISYAVCPECGKILYYVETLY